MNVAQLLSYFSKMIGMALERFSNGRYRGWVDPLLELPHNLLENPHSLEKQPGAELLLDCLARRIFRLDLEYSGAARSCFVYLFRNQSFSRFFRRYYANRIRLMAEGMRKAGFQTLEVVAAFRPRSQWLNRESWLIAGEIPSVFELPSTGKHIYQLHEWVHFDENMAALVAAQLAALHQSGFVHGDLKARHVLARKNSPSAPSEIVFVDLEKASRIPRLMAPAHDLLAARDLIQLLASLPDSQQGRSLAAVRSTLLEQYFRNRQISSFRAGLIRRAIRLYQPGGRLQQGRTVLQSLLKR